MFHTFEQFKMTDQPTSVAKNEISDSLKVRGLEGRSHGEELIPE